MQLDTNILLQKIRKDHLTWDILFFPCAITKSFDLQIKICRLHFSMSLLNVLMGNAKDPCYQERGAKRF